MQAMQSLVKMRVYSTLRCHHASITQHECMLCSRGCHESRSCTVATLPMVTKPRLQIYRVLGFCAQQRREMNKGWKLRSFRLTKAVVLPDIKGIWASRRRIKVPAHGVYARSRVHSQSVGCRYAWDQMMCWCVLPGGCIWGCGV
jgi:hypothetical protein